MSFFYRFSAVKGLQAGREYYIAMIPLGILSKLFGKENEYVPPEYRAQRCINQARIPEIARYILDNRDTYVFSALSASIDGNFKFISSELDANLGILEVDMNAAFLINDGQHRKAAIDEALSEAPELAKETISVVFFEDEGLSRSQQMFADLNKHAVKSTVSLSTLYDSRDDLANAVKRASIEVPFLAKYIDKEKDNLGKNAGKLFTLSNFLKANQRILKDDVITKEDGDFLVQYWNCIFNSIDEWRQLEHKRMHKCDLRENYMLTLSITMQAFGRLGRYFYEHKYEMGKLNALNSIDWMRSNDDWKGRALDNNGKVIANEDAVIKICSYIKSKLKIALTKEEEKKENELRR